MVRLEERSGVVERIEDSRDRQMFLKTNLNTWLLATSSPAHWPISTTGGTSHRVTEMLDLAAQHNGMVPSALACQMEAA